MRLVDRVREFLKSAEGRDVDLAYLRTELRLDPNDSKVYANLRHIMSEVLTREKVVKPSGRRDGVYRVVRQFKPVRVFSPDRTRRPVYDLKFPRDSKTGEPISIADALVIREGDVITIGGVKNKGKTTLCLLFGAENLHLNPVLMGNEYTVVKSDNPGEGTVEPYEPAPRFLSRLDRMSDWVAWTDKDGYDRFTLLPVTSDYAEYVVADRLNIIDWINLDGGELYNISKVIEAIKHASGRGVTIAVLQKSEMSGGARGGQFVEDFSDLYLLLDGFGDDEDDILMTVKVAKERKGHIGKTYAYRIVEGGTQIWNFREVKRCGACRGTGYIRGELCTECFGTKFVNVRED